MRSREKLREQRGRAAKPSGLVSDGSDPRGCSSETVGGWNPVSHWEDRGEQGQAGYVREYFKVSFLSAWGTMEVRGQV